MCTFNKVIGGKNFLYFRGHMISYNFKYNQKITNPAEKYCNKLDFREWLQAMINVLPQMPTGPYPAPPNGKT
jgi:hypothetical protein